MTKGKILNVKDYLERRRDAHIAQLVRSGFTPEQAEEVTDCGMTDSQLFAIAVERQGEGIERLARAVEEFLARFEADRMRRAARVDQNQQAIVQGLRDAGCDVAVIKLPVDIVVGYEGRNYLMEVKRPGEPLQFNQHKFLTEWKGQKALVTTLEEALHVVGLK